MSYYLVGATVVGAGEDFDDPKNSEETVCATLADALELAAGILGARSRAELDKLAVSKAPALRMYERRGRGTEIIVTVTRVADRRS